MKKKTKIEPKQAATPHAALNWTSVHQRMPTVDELKRGIVTARRHGGSKWNIGGMSGGSISTYDEFWIPTSDITVGLPAGLGPMPEY